MTNLDSILKSRDITLPTKFHLVKAMVFPVVVYGCESWTIKKADCWRTDVFELWCWRRFLRVSWTAKRSNQSILKEISPEYSLEGLMRKLKLQYFGHLMWRADSFERPWCWERLRAGEEGDDRGWDGWMASPTQWTWVWASYGSWWRTRQAWRATSHGVTKSRTWMSDWTTNVIQRFYNSEPQHNPNVIQKNAKNFKGARLSCTRKRFKILISLNHLIVASNNYYLYHFCLDIHF